MTYTVSGQAPYRLDPLDLTPPLVPDADHPGMEYNPHKVVTEWVENKFLNPLTPGSTPTVTDDDGKKLSAADIAAVLVTPFLLDGFSGTYAYDTPENNSKAMALLAELTVSIDPNNYPYARHMFLAQSMDQAKLPAPSDRVVYTGDNAVRPSAKELLTAVAQPPSPTTHNEGQQAWDQFFLGIGAAYRPAVLGMSLLNADTFTAFGSYLMEIATSLRSADKIDDATLAKCKQISELKLTGLMEPIRIRNRTFDPTDEYSFARVLVSVMHTYLGIERHNAKTNDVAAHAYPLAFDIQELICPEVIVFVNAEVHAHTDPDTIDKKWHWLQNEIAGGAKTLSWGKITRLGSAQQRITNAAKSAVRASKQQQNAQKRAAEQTDFSKQAPAPQEMIDELMAYLKKMGEVNRSQNPEFRTRKSFSRENRRRPDNAEIRGKVVTTHYLPDIHYFADTSGSMSVEDYMDGAVFLMLTAKKHNLNFYFSSHSHILSPEILLPTKGKSISQMYAMINAIPKVGGGNDFSKVYDYINEIPERGRRLNVIASDFGWYASSRDTFTHPKNLVYVPAFNRNEPSAWEGVKSYCAGFINSMRPFAADIDDKILGMNYSGAAPK